MPATCAPGLCHHQLFVQPACSQPACAAFLPLLRFVHMLQLAACSVCHQRQCWLCRYLQHTLGGVCVPACTICMHQCGAAVCGAVRKLHSASVPCWRCCRASRRGWSRMRAHPKGTNAVHGPAHRRHAATTAAPGSTTTTMIAVAGARAVLQSQGARSRPMLPIERARLSWCGSIAAAVDINGMPPSGGGCHVCVSARCAGSSHARSCCHACFWRCVFGCLSGCFFARSLKAVTAVRARRAGACPANARSDASARRTTSALPRQTSAQLLRLP